jgi:hypothetical protein
MSLFLAQWRAKLLSGKLQVQALTLGHTANAGLSFLFDYVLYALALSVLGPWYGGALMIVLSLALDLALIRLYDTLKTDWLGIEALKRIKDNKFESRLKEWLRRMLARSDLAALLLLPLKFSPFIVMIYLRKGAGQYNGMGMKDWAVFLGATIIGNVYWIAALYLAGTQVVALWLTISN